MVESRLGVEAPKVEVRFERLTVEADVRVGRRAVPTLLNCAVNAAQVTNEPAKIFHRRRRVPSIPTPPPQARCVSCSVNCFVPWLSLWLCLASFLSSGCMHCCKLQGNFFFFSFYFSKTLFCYFIISSLRQRDNCKREKGCGFGETPRMDCPILIPCSDPFSVGICLRNSRLF